MSNKVGRRALFILSGVMTHFVEVLFRTSNNNKSVK